ncbi:MAG TPA: N,N-dimethylformamidase beta subunit family domain-containing protein [Nitrososphaeraceae archaeon]|nr:N,N-dimethylformamidase beta subunit family domain-containing protein [Nitrososphaeraceae archaeon]
MSLIILLIILTMTTPILLLQASGQKQSSLSIVDSMREGNLTISIANDMLKSKNDTKDYIFSKNRSEISTPENNTHTGDFGKGIDVALIKPTFTAAAYNNAFYIFYSLYDDVLIGKNVTTDLTLLSSKVTNQTTAATSSAFTMIYLLNNLRWLSPESNITVLTDADVDSGSIFMKNGSNAYDVLILGHQEYVTQQEYDNLKRFVSDGGTMIIMDGNVFYAEVKYDRENKTITLIKGHGWAFNGNSAWKSVGERWANETSQWVGSNYLCYQCVTRFADDPFRYTAHEEQYLTNPKDIILLDYNASLPTSLQPARYVIATYELNYQKGKVLALGIYSDDIIPNGKFDRYFDSLLLQYALRLRD